jgi:hypothetical protein
MSISSYFKPNIYQIGPKIIEVKGHQGKAGYTKNFSILIYFFLDEKKLCHDKKVHTYRESFGSFQSNSEMKDMKSDFLHAIKASIS